MPSVVRAITDLLPSIRPSPRSPILMLPRLSRKMLAWGEREMEDKEKRTKKKQEEEQKEQMDEHAGKRRKK